MKSNRTVIGMFDSGIGGLSVLHEALKSLPEPEYLYYADTDHVPYGTKSVEEIREFTDGIIRFLVSRGANAVLIACNTATSAAVNLMRERYDIPIIGMEPAVKPALLLTEKSAQQQSLFPAGQDTSHLLEGTAVDNTAVLLEQNTRRVLVLATPLTLRESKLETLIAKYDSHHSVDKLPAEELVHFAERGDFSEKRILTYLEEILKPFDRTAYGAVVLGCTHFNYFLPELRKVFPQGTHFIDGVDGTVRRTADLLGLELRGTSRAVKREAHRPDFVRYFFSGREADANELVRLENLHARLESCSIG